MKKSYKIALQNIDITYQKLLPQFFAVLYLSKVLLATCDLYTKSHN